jgi:hypothetical protein
MKSAIDGGVSPRSLCGIGHALRYVRASRIGKTKRHRYLQLVAKTLYTVDSIFQAPLASDSGQFHWWRYVFEPTANFIARGCRVA